MNSEYAYSGIELTSSAPAVSLNGFYKMIVLAGAAATGTLQFITPKESGTSDYRYGIEHSESDTINTNYFVESVHDVTQNLALDDEAYFSKLSQKFKSAQEQGFVEIPESISNSDEFYAWLHE